LREVHPEVGQIKEAMETVSQDLADVRRDNIAQAVISEQVVEQIARIEEVADKVIEAGEHLAAEADEPVGAGAAARS
jgi:archaellum component FlaC